MKNEARNMFKREGKMHRAAVRQVRGIEPSDYLTMLARLGGLTEVQRLLFSYARGAGLIIHEKGSGLWSGVATLSRPRPSSRNAAHGLRRTIADKRRAVAMALALHGEMTDRAIADHCDVSNTFVGEIRRGQVSTWTPETHRVGKDGKRYPVTMRRSGETAIPRSCRGTAEGK